ncbi:prostasin-like [Bradysia coprophila]|uniref:prostasin-like n=1 Tax=Bradysia coprophila TaxID=38358 RepID=UPI00187D84F8|nr:prostasin-like [Bradysia coprophila]
MSSNVCIVRSLILLFIHLGFKEISANECGTTEYIDPKIVGGTATVRGAWPFLAALFYVEDPKFFCGSTVISGKHVLTAAHCVQQKNSRRKLAPEDVTVLLGAYNLDLKIERGIEQRDVEAIYLHPDWRAFSDQYDADLAILVLSRIVEFTKYIRPICMPADDLPIDTPGSIVGWGLSERSTDNHPESIPLHAYTKALNDSYCYTTQQFLALFSSTRVFCGGGEGSPNKGDSGGGFFILSGSSWTQYGIISASISDARGNVLPNSFTLYTNLRAFRSWIDETVEKDGSSVMTAREKEKVKTDVWCNYEIVLESLYKCSVWGVNVTNTNFEVGSFTGSHVNGYDAQNVTEIWFWTGTLEHIPFGIGRKFNVLEKFWVSYDDRNLGLKRLQRSNFKDMGHLWYIDVKYNDVDTVDEDTLRDLPNLKYFVINNNKLKMLQKHTFEKNTKLKHVNANSNQLQFVHGDLFKNNQLLEEALFKDNNLKTISVDFTRLGSIKTIDFRGNQCIDKELGDVNNSTELQTLLNYQCNRMDRFFFS